MRGFNSRRLKPAPWGTPEQVYANAYTRLQSLFGSTVYMTALIPLWTDLPSHLYYSNMTEEERDYYILRGGKTYPEVNLPAIVNGFTDDSYALTLSTGGNFIFGNVSIDSGLNAGSFLFYHGVYDHSKSYSRAYLKTYSVDQFQLEIRYYSDGDKVFYYYLDRVGEPFNILLRVGSFNENITMVGPNGISGVSAYVSSASGSRAASSYSATHVGVACAYGLGWYLDPSSFGVPLLHDPLILLEPVSKYWFIPALGASDLSNAGIEAPVLSASTSMRGNLVRSVGPTADSLVAESALIGSAFIAFEYSRTLEAEVTLANSLNIGVPFIETDGSLECGTELLNSGFLWSYSKDASEELTALAELVGGAYRNVLTEGVLEAEAVLAAIAGVGFTKADCALEAGTSITGSAAGHVHQEEILSSETSLVAEVVVSIHIASDDLFAEASIEGSRTPLGSVLVPGFLEALGLISGQSVISVVISESD